MNYESNLTYLGWLINLQNYRTVGYSFYPTLRGKTMKNLRIIFFLPSKSDTLHDLVILSKMSILFLNTVTSYVILWVSFIYIFKLNNWFNH